MSWSRIEVVESKIKICEDAGSIPVQISRYGNLVTSSFVGIKLKRGTATPGVDFIPSSATQIQFDQGINVVCHVNIYQNTIPNFSGKKIRAPIEAHQIAVLL